MRLLINDLMLDLLKKKKRFGVMFFLLGTLSSGCNSLPSVKRDEVLMRINSVELELKQGETGQKKIGSLLKTFLTLRKEGYEFPMKKAPNLSEYDLETLKVILVNLSNGLGDFYSWFETMQKNWEAGYFANFEYYYGKSSLDEAIKHFSSDIDLLYKTLKDIEDQVENESFKKMFGKDLFTKLDTERKMLRGLLDTQIGNLIKSASYLNRQDSQQAAIDLLKIKKYIEKLDELINQL